MVRASIVLYVVCLLGVVGLGSCGQGPLSHFNSVTEALTFTEPIQGEPPIYFNHLDAGEPPSLLPVITSVSPGIAYRSNDKQQIIITGSNLTTGDLVIFNNNISQPAKGTLHSSSYTLHAIIDLSVIKYAGIYPLYVLRCKNVDCTVAEETNELFLNVKDPPCAPVGVTCNQDMKPRGSEGCAIVNNQKVCRPKCTNATQCKDLPGAPANASCANNFCQ